MKTTLDDLIFINIKKKVTEISKILNNFQKDNSVSFMSGKLGIALFLAYYAKLFEEQKISKYFFNIISDVIDFYNHNDFRPFFAGGIAGLGWTYKKYLKVLRIL